MVIIIEDKKLRNVKLTIREIDEIISVLESQPYNVFTFMRYDRIIKKLGGENGK